MKIASKDRLRKRGARLIPPEMAKKPFRVPASEQTPSLSVLLQSAINGHGDKLLWNDKIIAPVPEGGWVTGIPEWAELLLADYKRTRRRLSHRRVIRVLMRDDLR